MNDTDNALMRFPNSHDLLMIFVVPSPKRAVCEPNSMRVLSDSGSWVPRNAFWLRRLRFKDMLEILPPSKLAAIWQKSPPAALSKQESPS